MKTKKGAFVRTPQPQKKDIELANLISGKEYKILKREINAGSAIILLGSESSPIPEYRKAIMLEMRKPADNGVMQYDAYIPFKPQWKRPIVTVSLFDYGNKIIVHSIKRLGPVRSRTLFATNVEEVE